MRKIKLDSLNVLDTSKLKKMIKNRQDWINKGSDTLLNSDNRIDKLNNNMNVNETIVEIKSIDDKGKYKILTLGTVNEEELFLFRAGQKVSITVNIDNKYYNKAYTIVSGPSRVYNGEIKILVYEDDDKVNKYLFNDIKVGERILVSNSFGNFYFDNIRDQKNVIAIVSGDGILPIYAMMMAILDNTEDFNLTLFYTEKTMEDILLYDELVEINDNSDNINVNFVLSNEDREGFIKGYVTKEMISEVIGDKIYSFFLSGNEGLLKYLNKELEVFKLPRKLVRYEEYLPVCNIKKIKEYKMVLVINNEKYEVKCYNNRTIMQVIYDSGIFIPNKCNVGSCGFCKSELVYGEVKIVNDKRSDFDKKYNYIHPCTTYPLSDIKIIVR